MGAWVFPVKCFQLVCVYRNFHNKKKTRKKLGNDSNIVNLCPYGP